MRLVWKWVTCWIDSQSIPCCIFSGHALTHVWQIRQIGAKLFSHHNCSLQKHNYITRKPFPGLCICSTRLFTFQANFVANWRKLRKLQWNAQCIMHEKNGAMCVSVSFVWNVCLVHNAWGLRALKDFGCTIAIIAEKRNHVTLAIKSMWPPVKVTLAVSRYFDFSNMHWGHIWLFTSTCVLGVH